MKPVVTVGLLLHLLLLLPLHLLLLLPLPVSPAPLGPRIIVSSCCLAVSRTPVRVENIVEVTESSRRCRTKAILVKTKLKEWCLDPEWKWAKERLEERKSRSP